jgi:hypothetical protein
MKRRTSGAANGYKGVQGDFVEVSDTDIHLDFTVTTIQSQLDPMLYLSIKNFLVQCESGDSFSIDFE